MCKGKVIVKADLWKKILKDRAKKTTLWKVLSRSSLISVCLYLGLISGGIITGNDVFKNPIWFLAIWLGFITFNIHKMYKKIELINEDMSYDVELDEHGVKVKHSIKLNLNIESTEQKIPWEAYKHYIEYDDYIEIHRTDKTITWLPKTDKLSDIISFTKKHINKKGL